MNAFVITGSIISLSLALIYVVETLKGRVKPNKITWLIWGLSPLISGLAAVSAGVTWASLPTFMSAFISLGTFAVALFAKQAYWRVSRFDLFCGGLSLLALIAWQLTQQPLVAIVLALVADSFAGLPTFVKGWRFPETENGFLFLGGLFSGGSAFLVAQHWTFIELAFPAYLAATAIAMFIIVEGRKRYLKCLK